MDQDFPIQLPDLQSINWLGSQSPHFDRPHIAERGPIIMGCYGGNTYSGAWKNEDGALVWCAPQGTWEFAMVLDAHNSSESAELVLRTLNIEKKALISILNQPIQTSFSSLSTHLVGRFQSPAFRARCQFTTGETACLITARKENFIWWLSIGDCSLYLLHPELARHGQYALNQRSYYEWIGAANTFSLPVACFTSGVRELRRGKNLILLATDGMLEVGTRRFENPKILYNTFKTRNLDPRAGIEKILGHIHREKGIDSATLVGWVYENDRSGLRASPQK